jgi:hypothetical protein
VVADEAGGAGKEDPHCRGVAFLEPGWKRRQEAIPGPVVSIARKGKFLAVDAFLAGRYRAR